jgi:hypothetical protein
VTTAARPIPSLPGMEGTIEVAGVYRLPDHYPLAPCTGFAVLCGYAAPAMGLALFLPRRRDA